VLHPSALGYYVAELRHVGSIGKKPAVLACYCFNPPDAIIDETIHRCSLVYHDVHYDDPSVGSEISWVQDGTIYMTSCRFCNVKNSFHQLRSAFVRLCGAEFLFGSCNVVLTTACRFHRRGSLWWWRAIFFARASKILNLKADYFLLCMRVARKGSRVEPTHLPPEPTADKTADSPPMLIYRRDWIPVPRRLRFPALVLFPCLVALFTHVRNGLRCRFEVFCGDTIPHSPGGQRTRHPGNKRSLRKRCEGASNRQRRSVHVECLIA